MLNGVLQRQFQGRLSPYDYTGGLQVTTVLLPAAQGWLPCLVRREMGPGCCRHHSGVYRSLPIVQTATT